MTEYELKKLFTFYVKNAILKEFFNIASAVSPDGSLQFVGDTVSITEVNLHNTIAIHLKLDLSENLKNDVYFEQRKKYFIDFLKVNRLLEAFHGDDFEFFKCSIDETRRIFVLESTACGDGNVRRGFVPISDIPNHINRNMSIDGLDDVIKRHLYENTVMQIRINCGELCSAIKIVSDLHFDACQEGIALLGSNDGLTISTSIPETCIEKGYYFKTPYLSILLRFNTDYLHEPTFIGNNSEIEMVGSLFSTDFLNDVLKKISPDSEILVSIGNNNAGLFESAHGNLHIRYLVAPRVGKISRQIINDAYAKTQMFRLVR